MFNNYLFNEGLKLNEKSKQNLILSVALFDEAFEKTKNELKQKNIKWRDFPNLYTRDESFDIRMSAVEKGIKERINLLPLIKKFMNINFPDFIYKKTPDGRRVFYKQINDYIKLGIGFNTMHHLGLGKAVAQRAVCCLGGSFRIYFGYPYSGAVKASGSPALRQIIQLYVTRIRGRTRSSSDNQSVYRIGAAKGCQSSASSFGLLVHSFWQSRLQV